MVDYNSVYKLIRCGPWAPSKECSGNCTGSWLSGAPLSCRHIKPQEIYNLAAQSHVGLSFLQPELTAATSGMVSSVHNTCQRGGGHDHISLLCLRTVAPPHRVPCESCAQRPHCTSPASSTHQACGPQWSLAGGHQYLGGYYGCWSG